MTAVVMSVLVSWSARREPGSEHEYDEVGFKREVEKLRRGRLPGDINVQNLVYGRTKPGDISISCGECTFRRGV